MSGKECIDGRNPLGGIPEVVLGIIVEYMEPGMEYYYGSVVNLPQRKGSAESLLNGIFSTPDQKNVALREGDVRKRFVDENTVEFIAEMLEVTQNYELLEDFLRRKGGLVVRYFLTRDYKRCKRMMLTAVLSLSLAERTRRTPTECMGKSKDWVSKASVASGPFFSRWGIEHNHIRGSSGSTNIDIHLLNSLSLREGGDSEGRHAIVFFTRSDVKDGSIRRSCFCVGRGGNLLRQVKIEIAVGVFANLLLHLPLDYLDSLEDLIHYESDIGRLAHKVDGVLRRYDGDRAMRVKSVLRRKGREQLVKSPKMKSWYEGISWS